MKQPILEIKGLSCGYGNKVVVRNVSFTVARGEIVGIIGPNGSGKTSIIRAVSNLLTIHTGTILFEGNPSKTIGRRELAKKMSVVTQSPDAIPALTITEFVLVGRIPHWGRFQLLETDRDMEIARQAMALTGIDHLKERRMIELSGGERQLAFVARALAQQPQLLLLDEPTTHLDIGHQIQIMDLLRRLNREHRLTIVVVLHDLTLAGLYCNRLILLDEGRMHSIGPSQKVLTEKVIKEVYRTSVAVLKTPVHAKPAIIPLPIED